MKTHLNRRQLLAGAIASSAGLVGASLAQAAIRPFPLIPMTDLTGGIGERIGLALNAAVHDFGNGASSETFGINNSYLGPVLRVKQGQTLPFDVTNNIGDTTTLHWHGLHIPGYADGGPHQQIKQGDTWSPDLPIAQHASMNWFHSHAHGKTAQQVYKGLAGVLIIEDDASLSADLPKTYGIDDFTLVLQDKAFDPAGRLTYTLTGEVFQDGFMGDTLVVNGVIAPVGQTVSTGLVRLRILNACNARFLTLSLSSGPLTVIASDGGFLASSVETSSIVMSPGERYEVLIDMNSVDSNSLLVGFDRRGNGVFGFLAGVFGGGGDTMTALTLTRDARANGFRGSTPNSLAILTPARREDATKTRAFLLDMGRGSEQLAALAAAWGNVCGDGGMGINGQPMKMDRIDEQVRIGETEIWRISVEEQRHPFHIHGCSFRILSQKGGSPPAYAQGWKDMVHVEDGWSEVLVRFDYPASDKAPYMYHCHILEHEDCGMMGQFTVA